MYEVHIHVVILYYYSFVENWSMLQTTKHMLIFVVLRFSKRPGLPLKIGSAVSNDNNYQGHG